MISTSTASSCLTLDIGNNANEDPEIVSSEVGLEEPTFSFGDTEEIRDVRLVAFTKAWKRCLERIHVRLVDRS